ncbi:ectonucleoside triphosphate diphosphohydrolase 8 isoform X3 [Eurytemora carolleeae]|uniref:ectonucleoside triphosphate diphosphohydrolase 8 isoform X3 n=1 Tax=Eurytemora carolleeae TaxID=1294199 RepID=UPI000C77849A|nr:ectonucleoside triphosphate diphosphohydrolase 8 isoform X3 [Eurytemora carolleeae]|eukprot:XP_023332999.1 ectonucleoside triphosphate diphosphohydrolase 8-like isoform X3 [Eurytemora affinis]
MSLKYKDNRLSLSSPQLSPEGLLDLNEVEKIDPTDNSIRVNVESNLGAVQGKKIIRIKPSDRVEMIVQKFLDSIPLISPGSFILRDNQGLIVKSKKSVSEARIKDKDQLYLSTLESERALFSYTNWCQISWLCAVFSISILGGCFGAYFTSSPSPYVYGVVVDAGSVHTSVYTYRFLGDKFNGTGIIEEVSFCDMGEIGISSFKENPAGIRALVNSSCLRDSAPQIYLKGSHVFPMYLGGTAGMRTLRLVDPYTTSWIMGNLTRALDRLTGHNTDSSVVTGEMEGLTGWISTNYLEGQLGDFSIKSSMLAARGPSTLGALDWGGASAQITTEVAKEDATHNITLYGKNYNLRTLSHLCFGQKEALYRHRSALVEEYYKNSSTLPSRLEDPCAPLGSVVAQSLKALFSSPCTQFNNKDLMDKVSGVENMVLFVGSSSIDQCRIKVEELFHYDLCIERYRQFTDELVCIKNTNPPHPQLSYYAFSTYWYLIQVLNLPSQHSLQRYDDASRDLCTKSRNESIEDGVEDKIVDSVCFKSIFMKALLTQGYKIDAENYSKIRFVKRAGSAEVGWTLGHSILVSNSIPEIQPKIYLRKFHKNMHYWTQAYSALLEHSSSERKWGKS